MTGIGANARSSSVWNDAIGKPFSYPQLRARVEALLRRADVRRRPGRLRVGELEVDAAARFVRLRGTPVELSQNDSRSCARWPPTRRACSPSTMKALTTRS
jgi:hypothetical protein